MKKVAIVIITYNQPELLVSCLESLVHTDYSNYKIYLVQLQEISLRIIKPVHIHQGTGGA